MKELLPGDQSRSSPEEDGDEIDESDSDKDQIEEKETTDTSKEVNDEDDEDSDSEELISVFNTINDQKANMVKMSFNGDENNSYNHEENDSDDSNLLDWSFSEDAVNYDELMFDV
eukprot:gene13735-15138_t